MGAFDTVLVEDGVTLPKFPRDRSPSAIHWQTKDIGHPFMREFKLTESGRLLRQEQEMREKTTDEKRAEAADHGFNSWDEYVSFCENADRETLLERELGIGGPRDQTVADKFWLDHNMHGSFEFHGSDDDIEDGFYWSYEARFTKGDLDAIVFLGSRGGDDLDDPRPDEPTVVRF